MNNRIRGSVELSLLAVFFVLSIIGVCLYGVKESNKQNKVAKELYQDRMISVSQLGEVRHSLSDMLLVSSKFSQNEISFKEAKKIMGNDINAIETLWKQYLLTYLTDIEKIKSSKTTLILNEFSKTVKEIQLSLEDNDIEKFKVINQNQFYPKANLLLDNINDLIFLQLKEGKNISEKSFVAYNTSKEESLLLMILIVVFSIPLFYYLVKKINNLNSTEKKLIELEKNYLDFIDFAGDAVLILDFNTKIVDLNQSACLLFGYSREQLLKMQLTELFFSDEAYQIVDKNKSRLIYGKVKRNDGKLLDTEITNWAMDENQSFAIIRDVTERKKREAAIKESEEKYRHLFNHNPADIIVWDIETLEVLEVNNAVLDKYGYIKSEWEKMTILDYRHKEQHTRIKDFVLLMIESKETVFQTDGIFLDKYGKEMFMEVSSHKIVYNNRNAVLSLARDITEQIKAENQLKQSENRYHSLIEHAGDAIFVVVENKNIVEVNSSACQLLGYSRKELLNINILDLYPSYSSDYFATRWDLIQQGKMVLSETKLLRKDGSLVDVEISRKQLENDSYLSIVRDITDRKKIENELIEYKEKLKLFIEYSPVSLAMFDNDMNYIANSRRWLTDFQVANQSVIGMNHYDVFPELGQDWKDIHQRCLNGAVEKNNNDMFYRPDGKLEWIEWEIHPWKKANGEIGGIIMSVEITTEKKQATEMFKHQFENSPDIIFYIDRQFKIEAINRTSFLEYNVNELIGRDCVSILPEESQDLVREVINKSFETKELQETEIELQNNQWRYSRFVPIINNGDVTHLMTFNTDISTRKQAEQNLLRSEERYRILTENISDAILLVNDKFEIEYHSPAAERISGYSTEEVKSKKLFDFIHPDENMASKAFLLQAFNTPGVSIQKQFRILHKNGNAIWIEGTVVNLLNNKNVGSFVINYRGITSKKKLEEQQALMASIVNSSDDAIISKDIDGIITSWNKGAEKTLGYTASEMIGNSVNRLIPISHIEEEEHILKAVKEGKSVEHFETKRVKKDGVLIDVSITISPVRDAIGKVVGASKIMRDITDSKKTEEELIRYNTDLKKANSELDRFVYSASHDLRAPLKSILGLLNITKEYANQENTDLIDCLSMLDVSVLKLDGFIEDILNYSRNTRMGLDKDTIDFKELISKIQENYLYLEGVKEIDLQLEIEAVSEFVADSKRISIVLNNLISNAFKYRDITKEKSFLKIKFSCDSQTAKITIEDNGIGIDDKHKEKVFDMFYRATILSSGSGLGLYIVKETIDKLNGKISIESEFGIGTKFMIEIPNQVGLINTKKVVFKPH